MTMDALLARLLTPALINLVLAAVALVLVSNWRGRLAALAIQYTTAAVLVTQAVTAEVAVVRFVVGCLVVTILLLTAYQVNFSYSAGVQPVSESETPSHGPDVPSGFAFRLMATLMFATAALFLASEPNMVLPGLQGAPALNTASYMLMALGLLNLGLSEEPMRAGTGLLTVMTGFELFYVSIEPSLAVVALLAASEFGVALAVSYLVVLQYSRANQPVGS